MEKIKKLGTTWRQPSKAARPKEIKKVMPKKYPDPLPYHNGKEFEVNNWVISDFIINELVPLTGYHPFPLTELNLMVGTVVWFKPTHIVEWGTHIGKSARVFSETLEHFNINGHIYSIDLPDDIEHNEHPHDQRGMLVRNRKNVTLVQGDGLKISMTKIKSLKPQRLLFFIDGDHSYGSVKLEFSTLIEIFPKAVFLLHDTFYQTPESKYNVGPSKALREVMSKHTKTHKKISTNTGLPGMTLVFPVR